MNVTSVTGYVGTTVKITADDTSNNLIDDGSIAITTAIGTVFRVIEGCIITCETNNIRFTFRATATSALGHILFVGQSLMLTSAAQFRAFRYINAVALANGDMMVTPIYARR